MYKNETIAAISTGMTNSGIGIVRISGDDAFEVIDRVYSGKIKLSDAQTHTIHYGYIKDGDELVDEVLVSIMRAPRTFTGENTAEINCHGGAFVEKRVLDTVLKNGARLAEPGEFTKRAFLNGKMDLTQAEAVIDVILSKNKYALQSSVSQLRGSLGERIKAIRKKIIYHTAFIETALDDPEHISLDGYGEILGSVLDEIMQELRKLIDSAEDGRIMKDGIQTVILGKPNVGKSSILNVLSGRERAIVTEFEGTTRDILEEQIQIQGLSLNLIDTAGIRGTDDVIEQIGIEKAKEYAEMADLIIFVVDASRHLDENDEKIVDLICGNRVIVLLNKSDLDMVITADFLKEYFAGRPEIEMKDIPVVEISAKEESGIYEFNEVLKSMFLKKNISFHNEVYITNLRQKESLQTALDSIERVEESIRHGMPEDFYSIDLMDAYESLGNITGETIGEDLTDEIFSKFCMGK